MHQSAEEPNKPMLGIKAQIGLTQEGVVGVGVGVGE